MERLIFDGFVDNVDNAREIGSAIQTELSSSLPVSEYSRFLSLYQRMQSPAKNPGDKPDFIYREVKVPVLLPRLNLPPLVAVNHALDNVCRLAIKEPTIHLVQQYGQYGLDVLSFKIWSESSGKAVSESPTAKEILRSVVDFYSDINGIERPADVILSKSTETGLTAEYCRASQENDGLPTPDYKVITCYIRELLAEGGGTFESILEATVHEWLHHLLNIYDLRNYLDFSYLIDEDHSREFVQAENSLGIDHNYRGRRYPSRRQPRQMRVNNYHRQQVRTAVARLSSLYKA